MTYNLYSYAGITLALDAAIVMALLIGFNMLFGDKIILYKLAALSGIASLILITSIFALAIISKNRRYFRPDDKLPRGVRALHEFAWIHAILVFGAFYIFGAVMIK
jgi:hypothetical protein